LPRDWDTFYGSGGRLGGGPVFVVRSYAHKLPPGAVLDLAGGSGRNALFLASRGHRVLLLDASADALAQAAAAAQQLGLEVETRRHDLESGLPEDLGGYAGVVISYYVQRSLLGSLACLLVPGGVVLIEGYGRPEAVRRGRPDSPYYWEKGELFTPPTGLTLLAGGEGRLRGRWRNWAVWLKR